MSRSYSCELPQTPNSSTQATHTRSSIASTMSSNSALSHPSPTPSSASSSSNSLSMYSDGTGPGNGHSILHRPNRPRFGQTSPNQLRKLLALSDGAVIVPHHNNNNHNIDKHHSSGGASVSSSQLGGNHHHSHQGQFNANSSIKSTNSTSSLNSTASGFNSYYNNNNNTIYHHHHHQTLPAGASLMNNGYGSNPPTTQASMKHSSSGMNLGNHGNFKTSNNTSSYQHNQQQACSGNCSSSGPGQHQGGPLYPNQSYGGCAGCCNSGRGATSSGNSLPGHGQLRSPNTMMMMPPPQTSGLMHPNASQNSHNSHHSSVRRPAHGVYNQTSSTLPTNFGGLGNLVNERHSKQRLPVESSSVTSLRHLEKFQANSRGYRSEQTTVRYTKQVQLTSNANHRRPQCPDYDTTMQMRLTNNSGNLMSCSNSSSGSCSSSKTSTPSNSSFPSRTRQAQTINREDVV